VSIKTAFRSEATIVSTNVFIIKAGQPNFRLIVSFAFCAAALENRLQIISIVIGGNIILDTQKRKMREMYEGSAAVVAAAAGGFIDKLLA